MGQSRRERETWRTEQDKKVEEADRNSEKEHTAKNKEIVKARDDKDKEVDHDERLRIIGVEPGRYDAKVGYRGAKHCFVRDIEIKADAVFSIADKDLKDCNK